MTINRTQVLKAKLFEQHSGNHHVFQTVFQLFNRFSQLAANRRYFLQKLLYFVLCPQIIAI
ncbi:hypothetical protein D3C78_1001850 [compost metagenome]